MIFPDNVEIYAENFFGFIEYFVQEFKYVLNIER